MQYAYQIKFSPLGHDRYDLQHIFANKYVLFNVKFVFSDILIYRMAGWYVIWRLIKIWNVDKWNWMDVLFYRWHVRMIKRQGWIFHVHPQKRHKQNYILKDFNDGAVLSYLTFLWKCLFTGSKRCVRSTKHFYTKHVLMCSMNL